MLKRAGLTLAAATLALAFSASGAAARNHYYYGDSCRDQNRTAGTILGMIAGGIIGNQFGHGGGKAAATIGGVFLGGVAGRSIGEDIDCEDRPYAFHTYYEGFEGPLDRRYEWRHRDAYGWMEPTRQYRRRGQVCRDFMTTTYRHGREYVRHGTACRDRYGDWHFM
ncbi:MAG: glycine zipper 2TM domain-containing protein [Alphaproteobacteria bacterium]|nr:glycine zipper 2TM domain-containing protein [Alphaproteobacteria bacterium]